MKIWLKCKWIFSFPLWIAFFLWNVSCYRALRMYFVEKIFELRFTKWKLEKICKPHLKCLLFLNFKVNCLRPWLPSIFVKKLSKNVYFCPSFGSFENSFCTEMGQSIVEFLTGVDFLWVVCLENGLVTKTCCWSFINSWFIFITRTELSIPAGS